ncbi:RRP7 [Auxenochlorella protothecoides x Auxenochlorella symbiontica]
MEDLSLTLFAPLSNASQKGSGCSLPSGADFHYYMMNPAYKARVLALRSTVQKTAQRFLGSGKETSAPVELEDDEFTDAVTERLELVYDALDDALTASALDAAGAKNGGRMTTRPGQEGPGRAAQPVSGALAPSPTSHGRWTPDGTGPKSQLAFEDGVDNANARVMPKYDGLSAVPTFDGGGQAAAAAAALAADQQPPHPLQAVLSTLRYQPWQTEAAPPQLPLGFDTTPYTFVDTPQGLREMAVKLEAAREIAVDLEAHSYRSFQGFTCLIQLSTRAADYVVDALALRSHIGPLLGPIFADPGKLKVLHGSDCDIVWLQRDFGIYVANLFDTGQAARVLHYPGHGLAFLMDHFCSIKADKRYQLADWRQRPLSPEMEAYARADTHYLLFIYDKMREELLASKESVPPHLAVDLPEHGPSGALGTVLERSRTLCMLQYEREQCREDSFLQAALKLDVVLSGPQLAVFEALYNWRDGEARTQDESPGFICPRAQLVALALAMPTTGPEVAAALGRRARYVLLRAREVAAVVAGAAARQARVEELRREYLLAGGRAHKNQVGPEDVARVEPESREPEDAATNADPELATPGPAPTATLEPAAGSAKRALRPRGIKRPLVLGSTGKGLGAALIASAAQEGAAAPARGGPVRLSGAGTSARACAAAGSGGPLPEGASVEDDAAAIASVAGSQSGEHAKDGAEELQASAKEPQHQEQAAAVVKAKDAPPAPSTLQRESEAGPVAAVPLAGPDPCKPRAGAKRVPAVRMAGSSSAFGGAHPVTARAGTVPRALAAIRASLTLPFAKQPAGVADGEAAEAPSAHAPEEAKATEGDALEQAEPTTAAEVRSAMEAMRGVAAPAGPRGPRDDLADYLPLSLNERAGKKARQYEAGRRHAAARLAASEGGDPTPGAERGFQAFDYSTAKDAFKNTIPRAVENSQRGGRGRGRGGRGGARGGRSGDGRGRGEESRPTIPEGMYNPYGGGDSGIKPGKKSSVNPRSGNRSASFRG